MTQTDAVTGDNPPQVFSVPGVTCSAGSPCRLPDPNPPAGATPVDRHTVDVYERPTSSGSGASLYFPAIDITTSQVGFDSNFLYYRINLFGIDPSTGELPFFYAYEINFDADQQGDLLIRSESPTSKVGTTFGTSGVIAFWDQNNNMGGPRKLLPDGPAASLGGYEFLAFDQGTNNLPGAPGGSTAVRARIAPGSPTSVELAVSRVFLEAMNGGPITRSAFRSYASKGAIGQGTYYLHDEYVRNQAGSPYPWLQLSGAPVACPGNLAQENALTTAQRDALDSGTNTNTGILNPCYPTLNVYEMDNLGTVTDLDGNDLVFQVDLRMVKTGPTEATVGQPFVYTLTVSNLTALAGQATGVTATDPLPASATFISATPSQGTCSQASGTVTCALGDLASGSNATISIVVVPTVAASITNTASVTSNEPDSNPANNSSSAATTVGQPADLSVTNTDSPDAVVVGSNITYTQTVTNNGPATATSAVFSETVPGNTTFQSITVPAGWSCTTPAIGATGQITCTNPSFASAASSTFTVVVNVNSGTTSGTIISDTASASSSTPDTNLTNNAATTTTTVAAAGQADLAVTISDSPDPVVAGSNITYTETVTNNGPATATSAVFTQQVPPNTTFQSITTPAGWSCTTPAVGATGTITCTNPSFAAGASSAFSLAVNVNSGTPSGTTINHSGSVSSSTTDPNSANNSATATTTVAGAGQADLAVTVTDSPDPVLPGAIITYAQTVTNNGPAAATSAVFTQQVPANTTFRSITVPAGWTCTTPAVGAAGTISCTNPSVATGAIANFSLVVVVNGTTANGTVITDSPSVSAATSDPNSANNNASTTTTVMSGASADLSVTNSDSPDPVTAGQNITYAQIVTNNGPSAATSATFTETVPANTTFQSITIPAGWSCTTPAVGAAGTISCTNPSMPAGAVSNFAVIVNVNPGTPTGTIVTDSVAVGSATADTNLANNSASTTTAVVAVITPRMDLVVAMSDSPDPVAAGSNITYSQTVTNNGPADAAANVSFTQTVPPNTTFQSITAPAGWSCVTPSTGGTGTITCTTGSLAVGASAPFSLVLNVNGGTAAGTVINHSATATSSTFENNTANNTATASTTVAAPATADLAVINSDSPDPVVAGNNITYAQVVTNSGPAAATSTSFVQNTPANTTFQSITTPAGWSCTTPAVGATGTITCTNPSFAAGATANFSLVVNVNGGTAAGTIISDTATISSSTSDPNSSNNTATTTTQVVAPATADLAITNLDSPDPVIAGQYLTYTQVATNNGPASATSVTVTGTIPPNTTFSQLPSPSGWSCTTPNIGSTGNYTCTIASLASGESATFPLVVIVGSNTTAGTIISDTVSVSSSTTDPILGNNSATATTIVASPSQADLSVSVTDSPDPVIAGNNITYQQTVRNNGPGGASNVVFTQTIPANTTFQSITAPPGWSCVTPSVGGTGTVTCTAASVASAAAANFSLVVQVNGGTAAGTVITDTPSVTSSTSDPNSSNNSATATTIVATAVQADLAVTNSDNPDPVVDGSNITYTQTVRNNGPATASTVSFTQTTPANTTFQSISAPAGWSCTTPAVGGTGAITCTNPSLATGATANFSLALGVNAGTSSGTVISETASVSSATSDPNSANNSATTTTTVVGAGTADLAITSNDSPDPVVAGQDITLAQIVTNNGPAAATSATYTHVVPANTTFQSIAIPVGWSCTTPSVGGTGTITCTNPNFPAGAVANFGVVLNVNSGTANGTIITNTASVSSSTTDPIPGNNSASTTTTVQSPPRADLSVTNTDSPDPVVAGSNITYTQTVTNNGPSAAASAVFTETIPGNTTFQSIVIPAGWSCTTPAVGAAGQITCTNPLLASAASSAFTVVVNVNPGTTSGTVVSDTASVSSSTPDPILTNNAATTTTTVAAPGQADLAVTIVDSPDAVLAGSNLTYTEQVTNNGPAAATSAVFTQQVPANTTFQSISTPAGWTCTTPPVGGTGTITCTHPSFAAGASSGFSLVVNVNGATPSGTTINHTGSVSSATADPNAANNTATATTTVATAGQADLAVTVTDTPDPVMPGSILTYDQTVTNNGPAAATSAVFTQQVPANTTFSSITAPAGWTCTTPPVGGTGTISCTNPSVAAGATSNFRLNVTVNSNTPNGTIITDSPSVSAATSDPNAANNNASATTTVTGPVAADLRVTNSDSPDPVIAGQNITYAQIVTNSGPGSATSATFTETIPANTTFQSITIPAGWSCTTPAVGAAGTINCTNPSMAAGAVSNFAVIVQVNAGTPSGTIITDSVAVGSATYDPTPGNNNASTTTTVTAPSNADLAVTISDSPDPVAAGSNITYSAVVVNNGPATASNPVFTQQIPPNTTFQSISAPPGWTCTTPPVGGTGTVTCTASSLASGSAANFALAVNVNGGTPSGTVINHSGTVTSATSDPNSANNTSSTSTTVAAPATADLVATTAPQAPTTTAGSIIAFDQSLRNAGPAPASSVVFTQVVPTNTTFESIAAPPGWSCTTPPIGGTGTITCTRPTMAVGELANFVASFRANSNVASGTAINNSVSGTSSTTDPNGANNSASAPMTVLAPTVVHMLEMYAVQDYDGEVVITWTTSFEAENLGFNLYRSTSAGRTKINRSLIAGSALFTSRPELTSGRSYRWTDEIEDGEFTQYYLEDVDLHGVRTEHGPVTPTLVGEVPAGANTDTIADLGSRGGIFVSPRGIGAPIYPVINPTRKQLEQQWDLASQASVKLMVTQEGWYRVRRAELVAAGFTPDEDLALFAEGIEQPISVTDDAIEFYGIGIDTPSGGARAYWLTNDEGSALRIRKDKPKKGAALAARTPLTVERIERTVFFAALVNNGDRENFFGPIVTPSPSMQNLPVEHLDRSGGPALLELVLQGATDGEHIVQILVNGQSVGTVRDFANMTRKVATIPVPVAMLVEGSNTITFTAQNGDFDVSALESLRLTYPHRLVADQDALKVFAASGTVVTVGGFTSAAVRAIDVTSPVDPIELDVKLSNGSATAVAPTDGTRSILFIGASRIAAPAQIVASRPSTWNARTNGADLVIVAARSFVAAAQPLKAKRDREGVPTAIVDVQDLYDEFGFGERTPNAIREFLLRSRKWSRAPKYVILLGDASVDPRNYLELGTFDYVPTRLVPTIYMKTASDDWFADFGGTGVPQLAIGRLPARTVAEAQTMIRKIVERNTTGNDQVNFVVDYDPSWDFRAAAASMAALVPRSSPTSIATGPTEASFSSLLLTYFGHGSVDLWSAGRFTGSAALQLRNGSKTPIVAAMTCLNGYYHDVYMSSLAEALMLNPNGGAVAVWTSSSLTEPVPQLDMAKELFRQLFAGARLGDAVVRAKAATRDLDVRRSWILFGDPSMPLR